MWFRRKWIAFKKWVSRKRKPAGSDRGGVYVPTDRDNSSTGSRSDVPFSLMHEKAVYLNDRPELKGSYSWNPRNKNSLLCGHVTAGWQNQKAKDFFSFMAKRGYFTDFIDHTGRIFQQGDGDVTGPNVGKSKWIDADGKTIYSLNRLTRGVEMACGGKLKIWKGGTKKSWSKREIPEGWELKTSFGKPVEKDKMRYVTTSMGYRHSGWFECLTPEQETAYRDWILGWLKLGVSPGRIIEHADCSPDRRTDIGGCLSMPHAKFVEVKVIPRFRQWQNETGV